ncbi:MAG: PLP-dependent aminotransferase family protein [Caulobacter sp.]|nr:PLP-dependent aminotransferase family protein [Caulobacter sp.]
MYAFALGAATVTRDRPATAWLTHIDKASRRPIYLAVVDALEQAIRGGELQAGDQLPPQRTVADLLGVDFTTITRAYGAARERGLVEGAVGRGTFVRRRSSEDDAGLVDLSMNLPPPPQGVSLASLLKDTAGAILDRSDVATLMAYHAGPGPLAQRAAAVRWLESSLGPVATDRLVVCPGAQAALAALLSVLTTPGSTLVTEPLTYPGLLALARRMNLRLIACPVDAEGFHPDAFERICARHTPVAAYLVPTTQNPTASTMGRNRREDIARIAAAREVWLIEDDPYARLLDAPPPALAALAPTHGFHLATLSKTLSPGLRTAFLSCPTPALARRVTEALRTAVMMGSPLTTAIAIRWIRDGDAERLLAGVRAEARARRAIAAEILPDAQGAPEGVHVWLRLPAHTDVGQLRAQASLRGLSLVGADAFAVEAEPPQGLRISLGAPTNRKVLRDALVSVAGLIDS